MKSIIQRVEAVFALADQLKTRPAAQRQVDALKRLQAETAREEKAEIAKAETLK